MSTRPLALLSVSDKTGLVGFARTLVERGFDLVASGGTAAALREAGLEVLDVDTLTGSPAFLDGRVKTLHPVVAGGILSRRDAADTDALAARGMRPIDVVVVDLYPFAAAFASNAGDDALTETVDIGGVTLLRAAAKNWQHVLVVPGPRHYGEVGAALADELPLLGWDGLGPLRRRLAAAAFRLCHEYDALIVAWLDESDAGGDPHTAPDDLAPLALLSQLSPTEPLRYGENPHQKAGFLARDGRLPWTVLGGKALSYNNLLDLDAALGAVREFSGPAAVVVKHGSPCGLAEGDADEAVATVFAAALAADPVSAFGGIIAVNRAVDLAFVDAMGDLFAEAIAAPAFTEDALGRLRGGRKNLRLVVVDPQAEAPVAFRSALGGLLWQEVDRPDVAALHERIPAAAALPEELQRGADFAWRAVRHVKSNAIVIASARDDIRMSLGIGGGQTNRIDAVAQAIARAKERFGAALSDAVLASDAFFPFADSIALAAEAGLGAIVQPGGAQRDAEVQAAAEAAGIPMVLTGSRHFRH